MQVGLQDAGVVHALLPGTQLQVVLDAEAERARPAAAAPALICADKVGITRAPQPSPDAATQTPVFAADPTPTRCSGWCWGCGSKFCGG